MSTNIFRVGAERHRSKVMKIKINKEKRREKRERASERVKISGRSIIDG